MISRNTSLLIGMIAAIAALVLDQWSKWLVITDMIMPERQGIEILPFFNLVLVWNHGISFGIFASDRQPLLLTLMSGAIVIVLLAWLAKNNSRAGAVALGLVIGGAIGNMADRLRFGAVVDFLDMHAGGLHWPAFNVADSCIFVGVVFLCCLSMLPPTPNQTGSHTP